MRTFYLIGAATIASALDCAGIAPYRGGLYPEQFTYVHYANTVYQNQWYALETQTPEGIDDTWYKVGPCDAGTAGELVVDCGSTPNWSAVPYQSFSLVVHNSYLYRNQWYADDEHVPGEALVWINQGQCSDNAGATAPVYTVPSVVTPAPTAAPTPAPTAAPTVPPTVVVPTTTTTTTTTTSTTKAAVVNPPSEGSNWPSSFFAPFVDVCLAAQPNYTTVYQSSGTRYFMLAFVTGVTACEPTWGGAYTLAQGPYANFENDIATIRSFGGDVGVSFGGLAGTELADLAACQAGDPVANLKKAYLSVVDKFNLKHIDFDIESQAIQETHRSTGWKYRFEAVKQMQEERPDLRVSFTLPVVTDGLLANGYNFVTDLFQSGVKDPIINVMTMDMGAYYSGGKTMHQCEVEAIDSLAKQVLAVQKNGWTSVNQVYPYLGSTPMIGVNDVNTEIYTLDDARTSLSAWQTSGRKLAMWSSWSITRDLPCSGSWAQATCSSGNVQTSNYEFAAIMSKYTA